MEPNVSQEYLHSSHGGCECFLWGELQVWAGSKQKQLQVGSMQLMHQYTPYAVAMMLMLTALCEPLGIHDPKPDTLAVSCLALYRPCLTKSWMHAAHGLAWPHMLAGRDRASMQKLA